MTLIPRDRRFYHVFLASPGDVNSEREHVRKYFGRFNRALGQIWNVHFEVVDWENYSTIGAGRPQELITQQTLERCRESLALVIGIMHQRFGSPTGNAESGTEEEFNWALEFRRQNGHPEIKWYFRTPKSLSLPSNLSLAEEGFNQWKKVVQFRERLKDPNDPIYFLEYPDVATFPSVFDEDLERWLTSPSRPWVPPESQKSNDGVAAISSMQENATLENIRCIAQAGLIGTWYGKNESDQSAVENIIGMSYSQWIRIIRTETLRVDGQLVQSDESYKFSSRDRAWENLGAHIFDDDLTVFKKVATDILSEVDPKFEMPVDDRYSAQIHGKVLRHSALIRHGIAESLALLGSRPRALTSCSLHEPERVAALIVRDVLSNAGWRLWASLDSVLPLLAEASPEEFLSAAETALKLSDCPFKTLFEQEKPGITGWNHVTGLLWALETLAWDANYLARTALILAQLAEIDPGGNWANRPNNTLVEIFLPWNPHTAAPLPIREATIRTLLKEHSTVGWPLLLALLPGSSTISSGTREPEWRHSIPDDYPETPTNQEIHDQICAYSRFAISYALSDLAKLKQLINHLPTLPQPAIEEILIHLQSGNVIGLPEESRLPLWEEIVSLVAKHRRHAGAKWAMQASQVDRFAQCADVLRPKSSFLIHRRLFGERDFDLYAGDGDYTEQRKDLMQRRNEAVAEIFAEHGLDAVYSFADSVASPGYVGAALASLNQNELDNVIIPLRLVCDAESQRQFTRSYAWSRYRELGWDWVDSFNLSTWTRGQVVGFLTTLPFEKDAWIRAERFLGGHEDEYWTNAWVNAHSAKSHLHEAIPKLLEYGRSAAAVECLAWMIHEKEVVAPAFAFFVLDGALIKGAGQWKKIDSQDLIDILRWLQDQPEPDDTRLIQLEWILLPILDKYYGGKPIFLEKRLAADPDFYCELIQSIFRSENERPSDDKPTDAERQFAEHAYQLLSVWSVPPGSQQQDAVDTAAAESWMKQMRESCSQSGHLRSGLSRLGHVLVHASGDPDGLWIHRVYARFLDAPDAESMRSGFTIELFNSRGVHGFSAGAEERQIADKYNTQAIAAETAGYVRLATSLRSLAQKYRLDAEREARRDPHTD